MVTQKFMGRGQLVDRLAAQLGDRNKAIEILKNRGHLMADGKTLTPEGMKRNLMTAEERAKDRASKRTGVPIDRLVYDPQTNTAKRK